MTKKYNVTITETLLRTVEVEAESEEDARAKVEELYDNCDIVLSADDFDGMDMSVEEVTDEDVTCNEEESNAESN